VEPEKTVGGFAPVYNWIQYRGCAIRDAPETIPFADEAQTVWLLSFIFTPLPHVRPHTVRLACQLRALSGIIAVFGLNLDVTEASTDVYTETLRASVTKKIYSSLI
jgi:hypothetical protein